MTSLTDIIRTKLALLEPSELTIEDLSAQHAGHAGNNGGGHFQLKIVSSHFNDLSLMMRHRKVYQVLGELMPQQIHALSILAIAPNDPN